MTPVTSGPVVAREVATATFTRRGKVAMASLALPVKTVFCSVSRASSQTGVGMKPLQPVWVSMEEVSAYLVVYGELPENYITKSEAEALGWEGGSVERYLEGAAIGGDRFYNNEGDLPKEQGRLYYECDIDTNGAKSRGAERIVFSNDGLIYYTPDHYETFELLYGEE